MDVNTNPTILQQHILYTNIHYKHTHTHILPQPIIRTKTSMAGESRNPGEQVYRMWGIWRKRVRPLSKTLTIGENRALNLVCMKVRERGSSPFAGDYQALHSATGTPGMLGRLCSEATGSALHGKLSLIGLNITDGHVDSPIRWWSSPGHCSSCISQAGVWVCGWSWSCIHTWEIGLSGKQSVRSQSERTPSERKDERDLLKNVYLYSAFHDTDHCKAALQKMLRFYITFRSSGDYDRNVQ